MIVFVHFFFYNPREMMLYDCIHNVHLLGLYYPVALRRLAERRDEGRKGGGETFWHSICMLPYWLIGRQKSRLTEFSHQKQLDK